MSTEHSARSGMLLALAAEARIVAVLAVDGAGLSDVVTAMATELAEGRGRTLVTGVGSAGRRLDESLGTVGAPGLCEVLAGLAGLAEAARRPSGRPFLYLPAGGSGKIPPSAGIRALIERVRAASGTLLLVVPRDLAGLPAEWFDAVLEIGASPSSPEREAPTDQAGAVPEAELGEPVTRPSMAPDLPAADLPAPDLPAADLPAPTRWRRHRLKQGLPLSRIGLAGAALVGLLGGWWLLAQYVAARASLETGPMPGVASEPLRDRERNGIEEGAAEVRPAEGQTEAGRPEPQAAPGPGQVGTAAVAHSTGGLGLRYSVLLASYASLSDAMVQARRLEDASLVVFVAPTPVRGTVYQRIYAGALPTRDRAFELMGELTQRGLKETASDWDVRPAALAYLVSVHPDRMAARAASEALAGRRIPTYTIPLVAEGDTAYQVYAGAYETAAAASAMRDLLRAAGVDAELVTRRGEPR